MLRGYRERRLQAGHREEHHPHLEAGLDFADEDLPAITTEELAGQTSST